MSDGGSDFQVEKVFINKNSKSKQLYVCVVHKHQFILYTGRLEVKFSSEMDDENELITAGAYNPDATELHLGTSSGRIYTYRIGDGQLDGNPYQASQSQDMAVTQLVTLHNIEDNEAYLMTVGYKELYVYI